MIRSGWCFAISPNLLEPPFRSLVLSSTLLPTAAETYFNSVVRFRKGGKAAIYIVLNPYRIVNVDAIGFRSLVVMTNAFQALDPSSNLGGCNPLFCHRADESFPSERI